VECQFLFYSIRLSYFETTKIDYCLLLQDELLREKQLSSDGYLNHPARFNCGCSLSSGDCFLSGAHLIYLFLVNLRVNEIHSSH
jgi:hypothetical protein